MKLALILCLLLTACTDHMKVMEEYEKGNRNATELLLHGFNDRNAHNLSSELIDKALKGDQQAKDIIYAQIETLGPCHPHPSHMYPVVIPMQTGRR